MKNTEDKSDEGNISYSHYSALALQGLTTTFKNNYESQECLLHILLKSYP
jgi:hypothetical protein